MSYYLGKNREQDVGGAYEHYQEYLREHRAEFPSSAFSLGTAAWYYDPQDHRCPHDGWLESIVIDEKADIDGGKRATAIRIRLLGAYHDGHIKLVYLKVFAYTLQGAGCDRGLGDWLYDEFRISPNGHLTHE